MSNFFSVIMCVNRDDGYLSEAIESILMQDYENFEFIIVANNCSDDLWNSLLILDDRRVKAFRTNVGQLTFNLNYALDKSKGDYIVRMDADDISLPDRLSYLNHYLGTSSEVDILGTSALFVNELGEELYSYCPPLDNIKMKMLFKNPFVHPTVVMKKSFLMKLRGYSGGFQSEDYDLWLRARRDGDVVFKNTDKITLKYRINQNQSRGSKLAYAESASYLLREFIIEPSFIKFFSIFVSTLKAFIRGQ
ncbi:glycosyltransferase [Photobacterium sp. GB-72]|uniref:glycosyltransferase n=1 Tax=Photobacterium sp. GB-72 TaxID=2022105 RepID=UPI000D1635C5|nr:glycosyltransferase [Photobacterium sp. GB-72]PSV32331.1 glycosyl transferase family 2 [Photobacterium sp. GB-72]